VTYARPRRWVAAALAAIGASLLLAAPAAAHPPLRVFESTTTPIAQFTLDGHGRVAWESQPVYPRYCETIHWGVLALGSNVAITPCVVDPLSGSSAGFTVGAQALAEAHVAGGSGPKVIWRQAGGGNTESDWRLLANAAGRRAATLGDWTIECGAGPCDSGGDALGPLAGRDGVVLYTVLHYSLAPGCDTASLGMECLRVKTVRIRRIVGGGKSPALVPGAPPAAQLVTAGGRLAEQVYDGMGVLGDTIEIRNAVTGSLAATITAPGTVHAMAMSDAELAVIVTNVGGRHLVRYSAATGALLGSTPLPADVDPASLGICGQRIVFQRPSAIEVYRIDLHRTLVVHPQAALHRNLAIDRFGIRWLRSNHRGGSDIVGIDLPRIG
jgi:hypothetical protein